MLRKFRRLSRQTWYFLGAVLVYASIIAALQGSSVLSANVSLYVVQPVAAIALAAAAYVILGRPSVRLRRTANKIYAVASVMALWAVVYFLLGLLFTYGQNPLAANLRSILLNIWGFGAVAVALEYARYALVSHVGHKNVWFGAWITVIFALLYINVGRVITAGSVPQLLDLVGLEVIPAFVASAVLTYLAFAAGFRAMLVYRLSLVLLVVALPIVPKLDWYIQGVSALIVGLSVFWAVDGNRQDRVSRRQRHRSTRQAVGIAAFLTMLGGVAAFMTGILAYQPIVIMSNSMQPTFQRGDVVIVQRLSDTMDISVGDIIQYTDRDKIITHRVIDIQEDAMGGKHYITKGDNSTNADPAPITVDVIHGVVRAKIPFVGYPTVWLHESFSGRQGVAT